MGIRRQPVAGVGAGAHRGEPRGRGLAARHAGQSAALTPTTWFHMSRWRHGERRSLRSIAQGDAADPVWVLSPKWPLHLDAIQRLCLDHDVVQTEARATLALGKASSDMSGLPIARLLVLHVISLPGKPSAVQGLFARRRLRR